MLLIEALNWIIDLEVELTKYVEDDTLHRSKAELRKHSRKHDKKQLYKEQ